jgi:hypothetical protein
MKYTGASGGKTIINVGGNVECESVVLNIVADTWTVVPVPSSVTEICGWKALDNVNVEIEIDFRRTALNSLEVCSTTSLSNVTIIMEVIR